MSTGEPRIYPDCPAVIRTVDVRGWTKEQVCREFERQSISLNAQGMTLLAQTQFSGSETSYSVATVETELRYLGFDQRATSQEIASRASRFGLGPCPLEVAPYLRLQYLDQPVGDWIIVFNEKSQPAADSPTGFYLRRLDDGLWLRGYTASHDHLWAPDEHFVFRKLGL